MAKAIDELLECPSCLGRGQVEVHGRIKELIAVWITLNKDDQAEVLLYADYLKAKRRRNHNAA